jgi:hypothetical protein
MTRSLSLFSLSRIAAAAAMMIAAASAAMTRAQEFEQEPIRYSQSAPENRVSRLIDQLKAGDAKLARDDVFGYLPALLTALDIPQSSQTLVFSKTSFQRNRIGPKTPRALYFNDDVYVGYCQAGDVLEISAVDAKLGAVFYTLDQDAAYTPRFRRQTDNCLICHGSSQTKEVPGHVIRSVFADASGLPVLSAGTYRVDQTTPLARRWGGWYVTGTHGDQKHLGNFVARERIDRDEVDNSAGLNQTCLDHRFDTSKYLTPHSDIVALLVLEHQTDAQNYLARASFLTRQATHYQQSLNRELHEPADRIWDSTKSRIKSAGEPLVEYLLFRGEAELTAPIEGTSSFAADFFSRGPRDSQGRSLRDFDLKTRLFRYPCSYLVYSESFTSLPSEVKEYVVRRLREILTGADQSKKFEHLSAADRAAILEILSQTHPDFGLQPH